MSGFLAGIGISSLFFIVVMIYRHRKESLRINKLTEYLENINLGGDGLLLSTVEDKYSMLQDEIYKTVTMLYQTRDTAVTAKNNFADNLSNIAHQIKTPITAISLLMQMLQAYISENHVEQIQNQLNRLTHLEEALLLLSRIEAGTLSLEKKETDVFTLLTLAADNLEVVFSEADVSIDIPESGEIIFDADLDWTMEAMMNLFKNCLEHTPAGGTVHCSYSQNPLYTEILVWDEGPGFEQEDIPHLFERFYRGRNAKKNGIGIGLALTKKIIERQNGIIHAKNLPATGACFEIRFYCH